MVKNLEMDDLRKISTIRCIKDFASKNQIYSIAAILRDRERLIIKLDKFTKGVKVRTTIEYIDEYLYGISIIEKLETHFVGEPEENKIKIMKFLNETNGGILFKIESRNEKINEILK